jgi:DNA-binding PadR family transcriptional regulator
MRSHFHASQPGFDPVKAFRRMAAMAGGLDGPAFGPGGPGGPGFGPGREFGPGGGREFGPGRGFGGGRHGFGREFGPGGREGGRARRGDVRSAILGLLAEGPSNGYGLIKAIAEKTDGAWKPSPGSVYPTLSQLVDEGLVAKEDGPRGAYSLTDEGTAHVTENREAIDAALDSAREGGSGSELRDAARKLMGSLQQFRGASAEQQSRATEKVDQLRRELYGILAE